MSSMDSTLELGEQDANSAPSGFTDEPNSFDPKKFEENLIAKVQAMIADPRQIQSVKDKALDKIKKDKGFKDFLAEYQSMRANGMSDEQITLEARLRELETKNSAAPSQSPGKVVEQAANESVKLLLPNLGLDANDPEVTTLLAGDGQLPEKITALANLSNRRKANINPAVIAQPAGGGASPPALLDEYREKAKTLRGMALIDLKMEYRRKGLDIN